MQVKYFPGTDTLYLELRDVSASETYDLDEDMTVDVDAGGKLCAITIEHATRNAGAPRISYEVI